MREERRSIEQITRELHEATSELAMLRRRKTELEQELKGVNIRIRDLGEDSHIHDSRVRTLRKELADAHAFALWLTRRAVRLRTYWGGPYAYHAFLTLTAAQIVLEEQNGRQRRISHEMVHPEDLALIRAGQADRLPLVSEVSE